MPCREHLAQLRDRHDEFAQLGVAIRGVTFEPPERIALLRQLEGETPYPLLSDPTRAAYAAFGLRRGGLRDIWTVGALASYLANLRRGRRPIVRPSADLRQLGGDVILSPTGAVTYVHRSVEPADRPSVDTLLAAARAAATPRDR
ncbi:MAG: redoxin domain-containing protein [Dehalococcoidia bacterium]|nr:redoxin domain-containing protein [Dehalococcoidia bacterium]